MAATADTNLVQSPSPYPADAEPCVELNADERDYVTLITVLVVVGVVALFFLHVLGSLRRSSSHKLLHVIVSGSYALSYTLVSYTLGLMQSSEYYVDEFPVWAVCLLLLLGSTDSLAACSLSDIDNWKSFYMKHLVKGALVVYIIVSVVYLPKDSDSRYLQVPLWAILFVIVLQSYARLTSMRMASKSHLLCQNVKLIADYMQHEDQLQLAPGHRLNPVTMEGYRYVVGGERRQKYRPGRMLRYKEEDYAKITTVEQIWQCTGSLLRSDTKRGMRLKDVCLSMALSKMLNRRFSGFSLAEADLEKTHDFVFRGLLAGDRPYERAFRVIEVELAFVHDLYYTRYPYLYHKGRFFALCLPLAMVGLCSWLTYELFAHIQLLKKNKYHSGIYLYTTLILMAGVTFLEMFQLYLHMASGWLKVALIRSYVTGSLGWLFQIIIRILLSLKTFRPWEHKLGQYSLIHEFDGQSSNCLHYVTLCLVDKSQKGRKKKLIKLPKAVKQAVIDSLVGSDGHLTNGIGSLRSNGVHDQLSWACGAAAGNGTATYIMLVWHIATTICKHQLDQHPEDKKLLALSKEDASAVDTYLVATSLSEYCAYLIAFVPNLLPDHSADSALILNETIAEARHSLHGAKKMEGKCEKLVSLAAAYDAAHDAGDDADASLLVLAGRLAGQLTDKIKGAVLRWKVLADFWAEMMLYVAPGDDVQARAHLESLARGGEFITHLWALLTHAGVLKRNPAESQAV